MTVEHGLTIQLLRTHPKEPRRFWFTPSRKGPKASFGSVFRLYFPALSA